MKSGRASTFVEQALLKEAVDGTPKFQTWLAFWTTFEEEFCPKNEAQLALAKLETTSYYQGRRTVDEYLDEFQELIRQAGYKEGLPIVVKFRRGLNRDLQDQIAQLPIGQPSDDNPKAWYKAAVRSEQNRTANFLFHGAKSLTPHVRLPGLSTPMPSRGTILPFTPRPPLATFPKPTLTSNPVPMDIDAAWKKRETPDVCRRCGKPGHWIKECPQRFDIRFMTMDERHEWIQEVAAQIDAEEAREAETEIAETPADFPECSN